MKDKLKSFQIKLTFKRILIVVGALFLSISIGSSMKSAFAGQDINSLLSNWFNTKKTESIQKIDEAITTEKDLLMIELKDGMQQEIQLAEEELTRFTQDEIESRINGLRDFADELLSNISIDNSNEQAEIIATLDSIYEQAIEQMKEIMIVTYEESEQNADETPDNSNGVENENGD